jgi:hypothetical protein
MLPKRSMMKSKLHRAAASSIQVKVATMITSPAQTRCAAAPR